MQHELHDVTCLFCYAWRDCNYTTLQAKGGTETMRLSRPCRKRSLRRIQLSLSQDALEHARLKLSLRTWDTMGNLCWCDDFLSVCQTGQEKFVFVGLNGMFFLRLYLVLTSNDYILIPQMHRQVWYICHAHRQYINIYIWYRYMIICVRFQNFWPELFNKVWKVVAWTCSFSVELKLTTQVVIQISLHFEGSMPGDVVHC